MCVYSELLEFPGSDQLWTGSQSWTPFLHFGWLSASVVTGDKPSEPPPSEPRTAPSTQLSRTQGERASVPTPPADRKFKRGFGCMVRGKIVLAVPDSATTTMYDDHVLNGVYCS